MKKLITYELKEIKEIEQTETLENGDKVIKKVKSEVPFKVVLKEPSRQDTSNAKDEYNKEWSRCVKNGIVTQAIINKTYSNSDGFLSESEKKSLEDAANRMLEIKDKFKELDDIKDKTDEDKKKMEALIEEFSAAQQQFDNLEALTNSIYMNSAESISTERMILYNTLFLSFVEKDGKILPLVDGNTIEERLAKLDAILEDQSSDEAKNKARLYDEAFSRNGYFINLLSRGKIEVSQLELLNESIDSGKIVI